jgi:hypothetical protein
MPDTGVMRPAFRTVKPRQSGVTDSQESYAADLRGLGFTSTSVTGLM